jgi:hypothetical protein
VSRAVKRAIAILGAVGLVGLAGSFVYTHVQPEPLCEACHRSIHSETYFRVFLSDGSVEDVCCPRCALRFQEGRTDVTGSDVSDFETRERVDAERAFYVEDSSVAMCRHDAPLKEDRSGVQYQLTWDRCLPSLVAFSTREAAEGFRRENGGAIKTYAELKAEHVLR